MTPVPPRMLMCLKHWKLVPRVTQLMIWAEYREGQEEDKRPSRIYLIVQRAAIAQVADREGRIDDARATWTEAAAMVLAAQAAGETRFKDEALGRSFISPSNFRHPGGMKLA